MQIQNEHHSFTGMQRDLSPSKHPTSFLYDAKNIRLTPREGDTLLTITNEKGTSGYKGFTFEGEYLGHCLLNNYLIVFTHKSDNFVETMVETDDSNIEGIALVSEINEGEESTTPTGPDIIYRIDLNTESYTTLRSGDFSFEKFITAIGSYENEDIQKVYWTDGENQPRVINIIDWNNKIMDFVPSLDLQEDIQVNKILGTGEFPAGVIQYAFTYYNKYYMYIYNC